MPPDPTPTPAKPPAPAPVPSPTAKIDELETLVAEGFRRDENDDVRHNEILARLVALESAVEALTLPARPVFNSMWTPDCARSHPAVRPLTWMMMSSIYDLTGQDRDPGNLRPDTLAKLADLALCGGATYGGARGAPGGPLAIDVEGEGRDYADLCAPLARYVAAMRDLAPGVPVGYMGIDWYEPVGLPDFPAKLATPAGRDAMAWLADALRPLMSACDYVTLNAMIGEPESADAYLAAHAAMIPWLREAFGRPVWVVLSSRYSIGRGADGRLMPLSDRDAGRSMGLARRLGDAVVIHPDKGGGDGLPDWPTAAGVFGGWLPRG